MNNTMQPQEWYPYFLEQCKAIIVETVFVARQSIIEGKWKLGKLVSENLESLGKNVRQVGQDIGVSHSELYACIQFSEKYPDLEKFLETKGKNVSWHSIVHTLLPAETSKTETVEDEQLCPKCGQKIKRGSPLYQS